jgi:hypothetical protein
MPPKTIPKLRIPTLMVVISCCAGLLGCSGTGPLSSRSHAPTAPPYGPVQVSGRARRPTDVNAGGINVRGRDLEFGGGSDAKVTSVTISHDDWNTIIATSRVPVDVGLMLDPGYNASGIAQNRFQYLADRISKLGIIKFDELGILGSQVYGNYMLTTAIYNPTGQVDEISGLGVKITSKPPKIIIANHTFYRLHHGGCIIPARTVYFAFLKFKKYTPMPHSARTIAYNFSPINLTVCLRQLCHKGTPISLCQD